MIYISFRVRRCERGGLPPLIVVVVPLALTAAMQMQLCNDNDYLHRVGVVGGGGRGGRGSSWLEIGRQ